MASSLAELVETDGLNSAKKLNDCITLIILIFLNFNLESILTLILPYTWNTRGFVIVKYTCKKSRLTLLANYNCYKRIKKAINKNQSNII